MIPELLLELYNARLKVSFKGDLIFRESETSKFYYQIQSGSIKMFNLSESGKEFTQGVFTKGQSFGEPPLLEDFEYPASSICLEKTTLFVLPKFNLLELFKNHLDVHQAFTKMLCERLYYKAKMMQEISIHSPEHRILMLLNYLKSQNNYDGLYEVPLTRLQISEMTGLRVETVIKCIKKLETINKLSIVKRKVFI